MVSDSGGRELRESLARLRDLLARSGDTDWPGIIASALREPDDTALVRDVQGWFEGMGGLNGLVVSPACGHTIPNCAIEAANRAFIGLRGEVFRLSLAMSPG